VITREVYNWGLTVYTSRYPEALTAPHLFILNTNGNGRLGDPKDGSGVIGVRGLQGPATHIKGRLRY